MPSSRNYVYKKSERSEVMALREIYIFNIKRIMEEKGLSLSDVAERGGLSKPVLWQAINYYWRTVTLDTLLRIAMGLGVDICDLLTPKKGDDNVC